MSLEVITTNSDFEAIQSEWDQLTDETLRSFDWHFAWWQNFGENRELRIYLYRQEGRLVCLLPMFIDHWLGQSRIRFIGSGDTCTDYACVIGDKEFQDEFTQLVVNDLTHELDLDMIELEGVTSGCSDPICEDLGKVDYWKYQKSLAPTWVLRLPETWDAFKKGSKKSLRRKIKKADSRLNSPELEVQTTNIDLEPEQGFETLVELHQDRFQSQGKSGVFADSRFYRFLKTASMNLMAKNLVEIVVAYENQEPFIAQIYVRNANGPQLYQAGIRSTKMHLEPGHLLLTFAVRRAIEQGWQEFDFLRGDHPYKPYWGAQPCELFKVRMVSPRLVPSTVNRSFQFIRELKHFCAEFAHTTGNREPSAIG